jgi:hypothetical protein
VSVDLEPVDVAQRLWHQTRVYGAAAHRNIARPPPGPPATALAKGGGIGGAGRPMTSFRQFEANRRNALKSTGPKEDIEDLSWLRKRAIISHPGFQKPAGPIKIVSEDTVPTACKGR